MTEWLDRVFQARSEIQETASRRVARAKEQGQRQWLSVRFSIPVRDVLEDFMTARHEDAFYWRQPIEQLSILGLGRVATIETARSDRFREASLAIRDLFSRHALHDLDIPLALADSFDRMPESGPLLHGGFSFSGRQPEPTSDWRTLGVGRLILPETGIVVRKDQAWVTRSCVVTPEDEIDDVLDRLCSAVNSRALPTDSVDSHGATAKNSRLEIRVEADRSHDRYFRQVEAARDSIESGKFEKVVLARSLRVTSNQDFDLSAFLASLAEIYPSCATLAIRDRDCWFVSATPEKLVALSGGRVETAAVAGSAPRGRCQEEETRHSAWLLASGKERVEHEIVEHFIRDALRETCGPLEGPESPRILKLEGIQHLETPLFGSMLPSARGHISILDLVSALHPTPAVGGAPTEPALDWLEQHEGLDRGWYAGPVGYVDGKGEGEFRVALRSALLHRRRARLFAGAGIVSSSDPKRELAETRLKLRALLAPLTEI